MRFTEPDKLPRFASKDIIDARSGMNNVVEPLEEKKAEGWGYKEQPPRNWMNWLHRYVYLWLGYLRGFIGRHTTVGGGAVETIEIKGVEETDICLVTINEVGASPVTIVQAKPVTDALEITFSADPSDDHVISYKIYAN